MYDTDEVDQPGPKTPGRFGAGTRGSAMGRAVPGVQTQGSTTGRAVPSVWMQGSTAGRAVPRIPGLGWHPGRDPDAMATHSHVKARPASKVVH